MTGIIIVNYNSYEELINCINSIINYEKSEIRIYIVENGSNEGVKKKIHNTQFSDKVEVIDCKDNLGYSGGNNIGIKKAIADGAKNVAIVNSDILFENDVISIMQKEINDEVKVVGPFVSNGVGKEAQQLIKTYSYFNAFFDRQPFVYINKKLRLSYYNAKDYSDKHTFFGMVSGCCFLIDSKAFQNMGFFDENVFLYSEERILSIKLKKKGYLTCYQPNARVIHLEGQTTQKEGNPFADYHRYASDYYTVKKYCTDCKIKLFVLKKMRLAAFWVKKQRNPSYKPYYIRLKKKMYEIEQDNYKIYK